MNMEIYKGHPRFIPTTIATSSPIGSVPENDKEKEALVEGDAKKEGFSPVRPQKKGRGQKRTLNDRQYYNNFNWLEVFENLVEEQGILVVMPSIVEPLEMAMSEDVEKNNKHLALEKPQDKNMGTNIFSQALNVPTLSEPFSMQNVKVIQFFLLSSHIESLDLSKINGSQQALDFLEKYLNNSSLEKTSKERRKLYQVKVKLTGDTFMKCGSNKTINSHLSHSQK